MQFAFAQQVSNPFGLEQGVELGEGAVWLLAVGSHAKLCRATVCGGEKSRRTCGEKATVNELRFLWRASLYAETKQQPIFYGKPHP